MKDMKFMSFPFRLLETIPRSESGRSGLEGTSIARRSLFGRLPPQGTRPIFRSSLTFGT